MSKITGIETKEDVFKREYNKNYRHIVSHEDLALHCMEKWGIVQILKFLDFVQESGYYRREGRNAKWAGTGDNIKKRYTSSQMIDKYLKTCKP